MLTNVFLCRDPSAVTQTGLGRVSVQDGEPEREQSALCVARVQVHHAPGTGVDSVPPVIASTESRVS